MSNWLFPSPYGDMFFSILWGFGVKDPNYPFPSPYGDMFFSIPPFCGFLFHPG